MLEDFLINQNLERKIGTAKMCYLYVLLIDKFYFIVLTTDWKQSDSRDENPNEFLPPYRTATRNQS